MCSFVTKEYLSYALLKYMLKLELLPEIHNKEKETWGYAQKLSPLKEGHWG